MVSELLTLINRERAIVGLAPLIYRDDLTASATIRAQEASQVWSHNRPNGQPYYTADDRIYGENLAKGCKTPDAVISAWMASPSHKDNLLNGRYKGACIGECNGVISLEFTI